MAETRSPYTIDLDRNAANYVPLSPLGFIARSAAVFPDRLAVVHGERRYSWRKYGCSSYMHAGGRRCHENVFFRYKHPLLPR